MNTITLELTTAEINELVNSLGSAIDDCRQLIRSADRKGETVASIKKRLDLNKSVLQKHVRAFLGGA
jgi:hypothetical protein